MIMISIGIAFLFLCGGLAINCIISDAHPGIYLGTLLACVGFAILMTTYHESKPSAIDVYRGITTLEITYRDSIPVDSVVIFKDKIK